MCADGKFRPDIYENIQAKQHYFRTMSMISSALQLYKGFHFSNEQLHDDHNLQSEMTNKKCKYFYSKLLCQTAVEPHFKQKWSLDFHTEIDCVEIYRNKLKAQPEMKIAEFNYKLVNGILATGKNLYIWKKIDSDICFYCHNGVHNIKHLLMECKYVGLIWHNIGHIFNKIIVWQDIVLGLTNSKEQNIIISLITYLIYKKCLIDRDTVNTRNIELDVYIKQEMIYRRELYKKLSFFETTKKLLEYVIDNL